MTNLAVYLKIDRFLTTEKKIQFTIHNFLLEGQNNQSERPLSIAR